MPRKRTPRLDIREFARLGGKARAKKLTKKQRSEAARKAVLARWKKEKGPGYRPPE